MKKKISKIWSIGLTFVLAVSLLLVAAPGTVSAADPVINEWDEFSYPDEGEDGDWFRDPNIGAIGPIAEAINGDLYAATTDGDSATMEPYLATSGNGTAEWSTDGDGDSVKLVGGIQDGDSWAAVGVPIDGLIALSSVDEFEYTYYFASAGEYGPHICFYTHDPVDGETAEISLYSGGSGIQAAVAGWNTVTITPSSPTEFFWWGSETTTGTIGAAGTWPWYTLGTFQTQGDFANHVIDRIQIEYGWWGSGDASEPAYVGSASIEFDGNTGVEGFEPVEPMLLKSTDGGRTWEETDYTEDLTGEGAIVDMVCSSIDEDILYVTDGNYVYKTDDGGDEWDYVAKASLEEALMGACGIPIMSRPITSIDVGYNDDDDPFVFIGTRTVMGAVSSGSVYYIPEAGYPAAWTDLQLSCYSTGDYYALAVGCTPDFADSGKTFAVVTDGSETHVVSNIGVTCDWTEFAELVWDCVTDNNFGSRYASRIGFPDDWEDTETLFVGVVDCNTCYGDGGDVYAVSEDEAIDRNVRPGTGGCEGEATDIISLDVCGNTDDGSLIAGAFCDNTVYYSSDGGWEWDASVKNPTGDWLTYVLWIGDCGESALAATAGCEAAVSLSCVSEEEDAEEVGMSWNQISLIATDITCVLDIDHSPGYITDSETLFMVTESDGWCYSTSLFRYDGTYWERVFCSTTYEDEFISSDEQIRLVLVSPDFLDTEAVFVANYDFDIFMSLDAGCSWDRLGYPCDPIDIDSWAVLDEDTIYVGSNDGVVYLTERHGSRSWDECLVEDADEGTDAGDIRYFAFDIADDTMTILVGDDDSQVFLCEVDPDEDWEDQEWHLVGDCAAVLDPGDTDEDTCVAFDPGYAVTDDAGENMIYAAADHVIARCIIDWGEDWADQEWTEIYDDDDAEFWGIKVVGDTALYVGDKDGADTNDGGMVRSLNPTEEDEDDIEFDHMIAGLPSGTELRGLRTRTFGENGCPDSNVLWAIGEDGYCAEVWFFEDTLAFPVILVSPADGAEIGETTEVTLEWEDFCTAESYEIDLYRYCEECPDEEEPVTFDPVCITCDAEDCVGCSDETCCYVVDGLEPGSTYYWSVRVCTIEDEDGEVWDMLSKWSEEQTFITELSAVPYLCSPVCGAEDVIITPNFSWDAVSDATSYEVQIATDEDFIDAVSGTSTVNAWVGAPELDYDTTYYWRVRALKDGVVSDWEVCIFTTEAAPPEPPAEEFYCPQCGLTFDSRDALEAHLADVHAAVTPAYIWVIIAVGALLVVAMLILIVRTRRVV